MGEGGILVLNAGSSSLKFSLFDNALQEILSGAASEIGGTGAVRIGADVTPGTPPDHAAALDAILAGLARHGVDLARLTGAGHRVVHGGALTRPARLTPDILARIRAAAPLAPLHNPPALAAIEALAARAPTLAQCASFDTAFHAQQPEVARRYALPARPETREIRRYGFHGISYAALVEALPEISGAPLPRRLLAFHLGNGASAAAILNGSSVATTMGFSPIDGLPMGTRAGDISAEAVLVLVEKLGLEGARRLLWQESGLAGLSGGVSDMQALLASPDPAARLAIDHFAYWCIRAAGSLIAAMGGLDAVAFTGGIGEHAAPVRAAILQGLAWTGLTPDAAANIAGQSRLHAPGSAIAAWIVPAREERQIARDTARLLAG